MPTSAGPYTGWTSWPTGSIPQGTMPPGRADDIMRALFVSAEQPAAAVRADYRATVPRTTAALGRLLTMDSITTVPQRDGSTLVTRQITVSGDGLQRGFPAFASYIRKYVEPARYRYRLTDRAGSDWFDAEARNQRLTVRFRSHDGQLQPLLGTARRMPDTLQLHVDALAKISFFTVGVTNMVGSFVHTRSARERGWTMHFAQDPEWHLPLITTASSLCRHRGAFHVGVPRRPRRPDAAQPRVGLRGARKCHHAIPRQPRLYRHERLRRNGGGRGEPLHRRSHGSIARRLGGDNGEVGSKG